MSEFLNTNLKLKPTKLVKEVKKHKTVDEIPSQQKKRTTQNASDKQKLKDSLTKHFRLICNKCGCSVVLIPVIDGEVIFSCWDCDNTFTLDVCEATIDKETVKKMMESSEKICKRANERYEKSIKERQELQRLKKSLIRQVQKMNYNPFDWIDAQEIIIEIIKKEFERHKQ